MDFAAPIQVILNPAASGGRGAKIRSKLIRALDSRGIPFRLQETRAPGHAVSLAAEATRSGSEIILVVGGDGTLHEVANGVLNSPHPPPTVSVVPVGTGNDFYRMVARSRDLDSALDVLQWGYTEHFDVGRVRFGGGEAFFVNLLGFGIDASILEHRSRFPRLRGFLQYLAALGPALASFHPLPVRITFQPGMERRAGDAVTTRTLLTAVTVGPSVGGGFLLNPEAEPKDGLLDLAIVEPLGIGRIARYIPKVLRGTHQGLPELTQRRISSMTVARADQEPFIFEMDGERVPTPVHELAVEVHSRALPVLVGKGMME